MAPTLLQQARRLQTRTMGPHLPMAHQHPHLLLPTKLASPPPCPSLQTMRRRPMTGSLRPTSRPRCLLVGSGPLLGSMQRTHQLTPNILHCRCKSQHCMQLGISPGLTLQEF